MSGETMLVWVPCPDCGGANREARRRCKRRGGMCGGGGRVQKSVPKPRDPGPSGKAADAGEPFVIVALGAHHGEYVAGGAMTKATPEMVLDGLLFVQDVDGWATMHRVEGFRYRAGEKLVMVGPRVAWPDGSIAARQTGHKPSAG